MVVAVAVVGTEVGPAGDKPRLMEGSDVTAAAGAADEEAGAPVVEYLVPLWWEAGRYCTCGASFPAAPVPVPVPVPVPAPALLPWSWTM